MILIVSILIVHEVSGLDEVLRPVVLFTTGLSFVLFFGFDLACFIVFLLLRIYNSIYFIMGSIPYDP